MKKIISIWLCLLLSLSLFLTPVLAEEQALAETAAGAEESVLPDEEYADTEEEIAEEPAEGVILSETEIPVLEEAVSGEEPPEEVSLLDYKNDGKVECWMEGPWFYWRGEEENLDYYELEIWRYSGGPLNRKLFLLYYYPDTQSIFVVTSEVTDSYFQVKHWYTAKNYIYKAFGRYYVNFFEYLNLDFNEDHRYSCSVNIVYKDGSTGYEATPWYTGADLKSQGNPLRGWLHQESETCYISRVLQYSYRAYNADTEDLKFQWQRRPDEESEWVDIDKAVKDIYTATAEDLGGEVRMVITADGFQGQIEGKPIKISASIPMDSFLDPNLRAAIKSYDNNPANGVLDPAEVEQITSLKLHIKGIGNLDGLKYLYNLEELDLSHNNIYKADLSGLGKLRKLDLSYNALDTLNLTGCEALEELSIRGNSTGGLQTFGTSETPRLRSLDLCSSKITLLDLREPDAMHSTVLYGKITDESGNVKVPGTPGYTGSSIFTWNDCVLKIDDYAGSGLEVWLAEFSEKNFPCEEFRKMMMSVCHNETEGAEKSILSLRESQNVKNIDYDDADPYEVTSLAGLEYFPWLERLMGGEEWRLSYANLSMNKELIQLELGGNPLQYLSVTENQALEELNLSGCNLKTIDLSRNHRLKKADLGFNELESVTLIAQGESNSLKELNVSSNKLTDTFDVSAQTQLEKLSCYGNQITELDVSNITSLKQACLDGTRSTETIPMDHVKFEAESGKYELRVDAKTKVAAAAITSVQLETTTFGYTGKAIQATVVVRSDDVILKEGTDYTLSYQNNTNAGTATVTIAGKGDYTGTVQKTFTITPKAFSKTEASLAKTAYTYTGKAISATVTVKDGSAALKKNKDFTVKYTKNKAVGTATVTITGKGNYTGTVKKTFKINPKGTKVASVTAGSKALTVKWKKQATQTTGYQIQYSTNKAFKSGNKTLTVKKNSVVRKKISSLKSKKNYYVRIRTYKTVGSKKYYSGWSKIKSAIIK